ncbi:translation initiation factor [Streptomyces xanthochromogenes]|uniref:Translation initiation factor 3 C-terminal domain-containing protein n=1 Tax=Streptomyces xanthochromogenes TaxID=67384 RepID=A0ABQ3AXQ3_9ACTN|nr:hypothetical protein [Streptomyces xanthochromogenes]GGY70517.1 hypothetical protein GCM10010326_75890 [Streptomyces xanthochromogenes]
MPDEIVAAFNQLGTKEVDRNRIYGNLTSQGLNDEQVLARLQASIAHAAKRKNKLLKPKATLDLTLRPAISKSDLDAKVAKARTALAQGKDVHWNVRFQGREIAYQQHSRTLLLSAANLLSDVSTLKSGPAMSDRAMRCVLTPLATNPAAPGEAPAPVLRASGHQVGLGLELEP